MDKRSSEGFLYVAAFLKVNYRKNTFNRSFIYGDLIKIFYEKKTTYRSSMGIWPTKTLFWGKNLPMAWIFHSTTSVDKRHLLLTEDLLSIFCGHESCINILLFKGNFLKGFKILHGEEILDRGRSPLKIRPQI